MLAAYIPRISSMYYKNLRLERSSKLNDGFHKRAKGQVMADRWKSFSDFKFLSSQKFLYYILTILDTCRTGFWLCCTNILLWSELIPNVHHTINGIREKTLANGQKSIKSHEKLSKYFIIMWNASTKISIFCVYCKCQNSFILKFVLQVPSVWLSVCSKAVCTWNTNFKMKPSCLQSQ